jgi:hypothetical protein
MASRISDNGPFDPRITSRPLLQKVGGAKTLTRGFIIQEKPVKGVRYRCNFLYNPSVLDFDHSIDDNYLSDQNSQNKDDVTAGHLLTPLQQSVSVSLLFDRHYELWDPSKLFGDALTWVPTYGVAYDVLSLYKITNIAAGYDATAQQTSEGHFGFGPVGPMTSVNVFLILGTSLTYYGKITSIRGQYSHWTQQMIPSRCTVTVSMSLLPLPQGGNKYQPIIGPRVPNNGDPLSTSEQLGKSGKAGR